MPNFSFLAYLEVVKKLVVEGWVVVEHVATVPNLIPSYVELL